jgi:hypothetical protein
MFLRANKKSPPAAAHADRTTEPKRKRHRWFRAVLYSLAGLMICIAIARPMLPWAVRWYVNKTLSRNILYEGRIGDITLNLWRGAYSIADIRIFKKTGNVPTPLFYCKTLELSIQWNAIIHHKFVGEVIMQKPEVNFVDASDDSESQTGAGGPWLQMLRDLFPFDINSLQIHDAAIHFRSYKSQKPVDVYLSNLQATIDDLTNIRNRTAPLLTTVNATGLAMNQAPFEFHMKLNPFSYRPSFELATRLIGLDVTSINDLALTYGQFDFKAGWFDLVIEADAHQGQITGYVKPLFRNLKVFDLVQDVQNDRNPLQFFWQALLGVATGLLRNQPRDQFGTYIPFTGDLDQPDADILATVGNVLRNAFIRAYLPRLENHVDTDNGMQFQPPSLSEPISAGDQP